MDTGREWEGAPARARPLSHREVGLAHNGGRSIHAPAMTTVLLSAPTVLVLAPLPSPPHFFRSVRQSIWPLACSA